MLPLPLSYALALCFLLSPSSGFRHTALGNSAAGEAAIGMTVGAKGSAVEESSLAAEAGDAVNAEGHEYFDMTSESELDYSVLDKMGSFSDETVKLMEEMMSTNSTGVDPPSFELAQKFFKDQNAQAAKLGFIPTSFLKVGDCQDCVCTDLLFITDFEGSWDDMQAFVKKKSGLPSEQGIAFQPSRSGTPIILHKHYCLVYGGDALDSNFKSGVDHWRPISITRWLVQLYVKNPGRVVLLLGNRDANKLRLRTELAADADPKNFPYYWVGTNKGNPSEKMKHNSYSEDTMPGWTKQMDLGERLATLMKESFGASIDGLREELTMLKLIKTSTDLATAEYVRDKLLNPEAPRRLDPKTENWWFLYLYFGTPVAAAQIGEQYALFGHSGVHPLMFNAPGAKNPYPTGRLMVPTAAGLLKEPGQWSKENVIGLDLDARIMDRVQQARDLFQCPIPPSIPGWVHAYARWKAVDFYYWQTQPAEGWTGKDRPGAQLMDAGLGNLAGIFRNAGFTIGGPCGNAWEYGINGGSLYASDTYKEYGSPDAFYGWLNKAYNIKYVYNGHFTEPGNHLPLKFMKGNAANNVIVQNHDLSKVDLADGGFGGHGASYSWISTTSFSGSKTFYYDRNADSFQEIYGPEAGSIVGTSFKAPDVGLTPKDCLKEELPFKCTEEGKSCRWISGEVKEGDVWHGFVQQQTADRLWLKMLKAGGFVWGQTAKYCVVDKAKLMPKLQGKI